MEWLIVVLAILLIVSFIRNNKREQAHKQELQEYKDLVVKLHDAKEEDIKVMFSKQIEEGQTKLNTITTAMDAVRSASNSQLEAYKNSLEKDKKVWQKKYNDMIEQYAVQVMDSTSVLEDRLDDVVVELSNAAAKRHSVNEALRREEELAAQQDFYKIQIGQNAKEDIEVLESIRPRLKDSEAISKLIYTSYVAKPLKDMILRVCGNRKPCGIYKITYTNGKSYIGKSTDIANRWTEHIKSSLSIGTIAHSNFHTALEENGVWNYTWEILEEVPKEKLTEREKYWINFYETHIYGYNEKVG